MHSGFTPVARGGRATNSDRHNEDFRDTHHGGDRSERDAGVKPAAAIHPQTHW